MSLRKQKQLILGEKRKAKIEEHFVAFMDILGFQEMFADQKGQEREKAKKTNEKIHSIFKTITSWGDGLNAGEPSKDDSDEIRKNTGLNGLSYYLMSDSIVVNIKSDVDHALKKLIIACQDLQSRLYALPQPVLLRGAIAKGEYHLNDRIAFGKALVDAYSYQQNYSRYPRVIISGELVEEECARDQFTKDDAEELLIIEDKDYYNYINSFKCLYPDGKKGHEVERFLNFVNEQISKYSPLDVREKYIWLRNNYDKGEPDWRKR